MRGKRVGVGLSLTLCVACSSGGRTDSSCGRGGGAAKAAVGTVIDAVGAAQELADERENEAMKRSVNRLVQESLNKAQAEKNRVALCERVRGIGHEELRRTAEHALGVTSGEADSVTLDAHARVFGSLRSMAAVRAAKPARPGTFQGGPAVDMEEMQRKLLVKDPKFRDNLLNLQTIEYAQAQLACMSQ